MCVGRDEVCGGVMGVWGWVGGGVCGVCVCVCVGYFIE